MHCNFLIFIMRKKTLKIGKNLLVFSKSLLVTIARTWHSLRFSVSQKVFNTSKLWVIFSKAFLWFGNGIRFWENHNIKNCLTEKVYFFNENFPYIATVLTNKHYIHFSYKHEISSVQLQICLGIFKIEPQE